MNIQEILKTSSIIAAARFDSLQLAVESNTGAILFMYAKLVELMSMDFQKYNRKKPIFIHFDLLKGLSNDSEAVRFIQQYVKPAGIVSTKGPIIRAAKKEGLQTIQRIFLIDTRSFEQSMDSIKESNPDAVEIMPGIAPSIVATLKAQISQPVILGGLIATKRQIIEALHYGADGISLSNSSLWNLVLKKNQSVLKNAGVI
jgi:glycerol uptake operon antiterminator